MKNKTLVDKITFGITVVAFLYASARSLMEEPLSVDGLVVSLLTGVIFAAMVYALLRWLKKKLQPRQKTFFHNTTYAAEDGRMEFPVMGVQYHLESLQKLAKENPYYRRPLSQAGKRVYRYRYPTEPVSVIPEPENPHDKNALRVELAGEKIGYVARQDTDAVRSILRKKSSPKMTVFVGGGVYKEVGLDGQTENGEHDIHAKLRISL